MKTTNKIKAKHRRKRTNDPNQIRIGDIILTSQSCSIKELTQEACELLEKKVIKDYLRGFPEERTGKVNYID